MQARWGTHGDHPIIVLAPSSVRDSFDVTVTAFNFSERYRTPVIVLSDEVVAHTRETVELPDPEEIEVLERITPSMPPEWYIPYEDTASGVPPMGIFGDGYRYHVTGLIHDVRGFPTMRADEIEPEVDSYLNDAVQSNVSQAHIIHGIGTGTVRNVVREYLSTHPLVKSFRPGERDEGGDGATVVSL